MDWYNRKSRNPYSPNGSTTPSFASPQQQRSQFYSNYHPLLPPSVLPGASSVTPTHMETTISGDSSNVSERSLYFLSQAPLYCADWAYLKGADTDCIALASYKEGFNNKLQVVHGLPYNDSFDDSMTPENSPSEPADGGGFDFHKVLEITLDYPVTNVQWDPSMLKMNNGYEERLAASLEVLRLYLVDHDRIDQNNDYSLVQTHILANNSTTSGTRSEDINTFPPVTSFDWNKTDPSVIITSSVDTTCTVWDLNRSYSINRNKTGVDSAQVKTQLIAHDLEVFDVKFIYNSANVFASVGNDGSMRVFDLRSLEHSTIIYEPPAPGINSNNNPVSAPGGGHYNTNALIKLATSNVDAHYLATIGVNSNQVFLIDMRVPGIPVITLDGSFNGASHAAINAIKWHPSANYLLTGGDDCQALVWDCTNLNSEQPTKDKRAETGTTVDTPVLAFEEELEVNNVCWRNDPGDWMGVVSGRGFQAVMV